MTEMVEKSMKTTFPALGTEIELEIVANKNLASKAEQSLLQAQKIYQKQERIFSRFDAGSQLSQCNQKIGQWVAVDSDLVAVAQQILHFHQLTAGFFDPRILRKMEAIGYQKDFYATDFSQLSTKTAETNFQPSLANDLEIKDDQLCFHQPMDFSGLVKGYLTDHVANYFQSQGWENFSVDSGGDIFLNGKNQQGTDWLIDIEGVDSDKLMLSLSHQAIATSGISRRKWEIKGQRFHHLINPFAPDQFNFDLRSVTVVADQTAEADVWAKVLFLQGQEKGIETAIKQKLQVVFLSYDGAAMKVGLAN